MAISIEKKKLWMIFGVIGIIILIMIPFLLVKKNTTPNYSGSGYTAPNGGYTVDQNKPKVYQLYVKYNPPTQQTVIDKIFVRNGTALPMTDDSSVWHALIISADGKVLFDTPIHVQEQMTEDFQSLPNNRATPLPPEVLTSLITLPYYPEASKIILMKYNVNVTDIAAPKQ